MEAVVPLTAAHRYRAAHAGRWLRDGWQVFRLAPARITLLAVVPILFEAACQSVPGAGVLLSKLLTPGVSALALVMLDRRVRTGTFSLRSSFALWRPRTAALLGLGIACLGVFGVQVAVAAALAGQAQAAALAMGDMQALTMSRPHLALVLASGLVPALALLYVSPRIALDGVGVIAALMENARMLMLTWRPAVLLMLVTASLVGALLWQPWLLAILLPGGFVVGYAMYRDVFQRAPSPG